MANNLPAMLKYYIDWLKGSNKIEDNSPIQDCEIIFLHILNIQKIDLYLQNKEIQINNSQFREIRNAVHQRYQGKPIAKIINKKYFWKNDFFVNEDVLDPRPDTETLIEAVIKNFVHKQSSKLNIIDLGTGSGCLITSLLNEFPNALGYATDISINAIKVAIENFNHSKLSNNITFINTNWLDFISLKNNQPIHNSSSILTYKHKDHKIWIPNDKNHIHLPQLDIIVSNPPYISCDNIPLLPDTVKKYDPISALTTKDHKGIENYITLLDNLQHNINSDTKIFFEIGYNQLADIETLLKTYTKLKLAECYRDINGITRCIMIKTIS